MADTKGFIQYTLVKVRAAREPLSGTEGLARSTLVKMCAQGFQTVHAGQGARTKAFPLCTLPRCMVGCVRVRYSVVWGLRHVCFSPGNKNLIWFVLDFPGRQDLVPLGGGGTCPRTLQLELGESE